MAMYVTTQVNAPLGQKREFVWYVGDSKFNRLEGATVIHIQADGDELDEILLRIGGIPFSKNKRVQVWAAPFAQFIWDNL